MATASPMHFSRERLTEDFLSCSLCLERYKQPKVLQCQHTFCLTCLQHLAEKALVYHITCPLCREDTYVPNGNLHSLKTNFLIESLLSFVTEVGSPDSVTKMDWSGQEIADHCELCDEKKETSLLCSDCEMWLCQACSIPHNKLPATKHHRTLTVSDIMGKAKEQLKTIEKELQELYENMEGQYEAAILDEELILEQKEAIQTQIDITCRRITDVIAEKKHNILEEFTGVFSKSLFHQKEKIDRLQQNAERMKRGLDFVKSVCKSTNAHHITNLMGNVEQLRRCAQDVKGVQEDESKHEYEFLVSDLILQVIGSSSLGTLLHSNSKPCLSANFPPDRDMVGELVHRLAYNYYITGIASTSSGTILVASNCNSLKKIGKSVYEVDVRSVDKPWGIAKAPSEEIIITDSGRNLGEGSVNIFDPEGKFIRVICNGLSLPRGVAVDNHGRIYVCDERDRCVYVMTFEGRIVQIIKFSWDGSFYFEAPRFVTVDKDNNVYVSDGGKCVKIFDDKFSLVTTYISPFTKSEFWDVMWSKGSLFVTDWKYGIHAVNAQGAFQGLVKKPMNRITINEPTALCRHCNCLLMVGTSNGELISLRANV